MLDNVIDEIINLKWVVVIYSLIIILACGIIWLSTKEFSWLKKNTTAFALFYNLSKPQVIAFALIIGRLCFVLCSAIFCKYVNLGYLVVFVLFAIIIALLTKDVKTFISSLLNSVAIFVILYLERSLYNYYLTVERLWLVIAMLVMMGLFAVLYSALQSINAYERIIETND